MSIELDQARQEILQFAMDELSKLRQETSALLDESEIGSVIEAIEFYESWLDQCTDYAHLVEWTGRAMADVTGEAAAAQYGWDNPEARDVFEEQDRLLTNHLRWIDQQFRANRKTHAGNQTVLP